MEGKNTLNKHLGPCLGSVPGCSKSRVNVWQSRGLLGPILMCGLVLVRADRGHSLSMGECLQI